MNFNLLLNILFLNNFLTIHEVDIIFKELRFENKFAIISPLNEELYS